MHSQWHTYTLTVNLSKTNKRMNTIAENEVPITLCSFDPLDEHVKDKREIKLDQRLLLWIFCLRVRICRINVYIFGYALHSVSKRCLWNLKWPKGSAQTVMRMSNVVSATVLSEITFTYFIYIILTVYLLNNGREILVYASKIPRLCPKSKKKTEPSSSTFWIEMSNIVKFNRMTKFQFITVVHAQCLLLKGWRIWK